jgi:hypothetical protein
MNYYRLITLVIAIFATGAHASQNKTEIVEQFDNIRVVTFIESDDITNSPVWNPDIDPLPLSVDGAIQAIRDFSKQAPNIGSVKEIELRTIKDNPGHWHYLVKMAGKDANKQKCKVYAVLMDGKVIPAIIEPESIK